MKKTLKRVLLILAGYVAMLLLLLLAERSADGSGITTLGDALWYSLVTLTTVGYGDLYPVSVFGRIIGSAFVFCSLGLMAALLSMFMSMIVGSLGPRCRLWAARRKHWYVLDGEPEAVRQLSNALAHRPGTQVICCCTEESGREILAVPFTAEQTAAGRKNGTDIFLLGTDGEENYRRALVLAENGYTVYCRTEMDEDLLPEQVIRFCPEDAAARSYWREHPIVNDSCIVLAGGGRILEAVLERAVLTNIVGHRVTYHIYGDDGSFLRRHYCLEQVMDIGRESGERDAIIFESGPVGSDPELLRNADRVILCDDAGSLQTYSLIHEFYPVSAAIHIYGQVPNAVCFGNDLYTPENVMGARLTALAREMNEIYRSSVDYPAPAWEKLNSFYHRSNVASADHLYVKMRLLGHPDNPEAALREYESKTSGEKLQLWKLEHDRWMRFYALNNWTCGMRDNAQRRHPLMVDFSELDYEEQKKDAAAWVLLGKVSENYDRV